MKPKHPQKYNNLFCNRMINFIEKIFYVKRSRSIAMFSDGFSNLRCEMVGNLVGVLSS